MLVSFLLWSSTITCFHCLLVIPVGMSEWCMRGMYVACYGYMPWTCIRMFGVGECCCAWIITWGPYHELLVWNKNVFRSESHGSIPDSLLVCYRFVHLDLLSKLEIWNSFHAWDYEWSFGRTILWMVFGEKETLISFDWYEWRIVFFTFYISIPTFQMLVSSKGQPASVLGILFIANSIQLGYLFLLDLISRCWQAARGNQLVSWESCLLLIEFNEVISSY